MTALLLGLGGSLALATLPAAAQEIQNERGVDPQVDYAALTKIGPWDDRNYQLTAEDLKLLGPDEEKLGARGVPAFYRVELRRHNPKIGHDGVLYPLSAHEVFRRRFGGYQIDGKTYPRALRLSDRWKVVREEAAEGDLEEETSFVGKQLAGDARVTPLGGAESAIKINPLNKNRVISGSNHWAFGQMMHHSNDGGESWVLSSPLPLDDQPGANTCCDPTVEWSSNGSLAYTATLGFSPQGWCCDVWFYRSSDNGATWDDLGAPPNNSNNRRELSPLYNADKEFLHVDHSANSPFRDFIYMTWHESNDLMFARSMDLGVTWSAPKLISSGVNQKGIGSDITTDRNGNIFYFWPSHTSQRILFARSINGGGTFGGAAQVATTLGSFSFPIPSMFQRYAFISTSADADLTDGPFSNRVYVSWTDLTAPDTGNATTNHARVRVAFTADQGASWTVVTPHATADANTVDRFHSAIAVDGIGTVHLIYYETVAGTGRMGVRVMHQRSVNGGNSWTAPEEITSAMSPVIFDAFQLGDYNGLDVEGNLALASFTDNRSESGGPGDSVDVYVASGATQTSLTFQSIPSEDGYIIESSATSGTGGFAISSLNSPSGLRAGDAAANEQVKAIVSFDTSALPDGAKILSARLRLKRGTMVGDTGSLSAFLLTDVKTGAFSGNAALSPGDFQAAATVAGTCIFTLPGANGGLADCTFNTAGRNAISLTGLTQARLYFFTPDNGDNGTDYLGFYPGEAAEGDRPTLTVTFEPQ